jgi:hypothetical protein
MAAPQPQPISTRPGVRAFAEEDHDGNTSTGTKGQTYYVGKARNFSCTVQGTSWSTAVLTLKWSLDGTNWISWSTPKTVTSAAPYLLAVDVTGIPYVVLELTTAEGSANTLTAQAYSDDLQ